LSAASGEREDVVAALSDDDVTALIQMMMRRDAELPERELRDDAVSPILI